MDLHKCFTSESKTQVARQEEEVSGLKGCDWREVEEDCFTVGNDEMSQLLQGKCVLEKN